MGKSSKRKQSLNRNIEQRLSTTQADIDEDSGIDSSFCSNLSPNFNKMVRFDEEMLLLKALMKEVNEPNVHNNSQLNHKINSIKAQNNTYSSKSKNGKYELKILSQPEEQHRARYLTEGSRGAIKDKSGLSHPIVKLCGYNKCSVKIQCFIGHDKQMGSSHLFYQASKITGKNSTKCSTRKVDGTTVIVMEACPENDMQVTVDCVGILKERNVDVEQKLTRYKSRADSSDSFVTIPTKKRSTRCRLVFRTQIPENNEILQVVSSPILCTQPLGTPEISKKSVSQCDAKGGHELFIIGKNFLKDSKVVWKNSNWTKVVEPDKEFLHPTHLICIIPCYDGPDLKTHNSIEVSLSIKSGGKYSDAHSFTFINFERVNTMTLLNGTTGLSGQTSTTDQLLVSNFEKPIILTMIGSTALTNTMDAVIQNNLQSNVTPIQMNQLNALNSDSISYTRANSSPQCVQSIVNEDSQMDSTTIQNESQMNQNFVLNKDMTNEDTLEMTSDDKSMIEKVNTNTTITTDLLSAQVSQYLPLNAFNTISSNPLIANNSSQMTNISTIPSMSSINCNNILVEMPTNQMTTTAMSTTPVPSLSLINSMSSIESKTSVSQESIAKNPLIAQNPVLTSTASTTPVTQATNISALSEMSDAELLCFINPATFDQI